MCGKGKDMERLRSIIRREVKKYYEEVEVVFPFLKKFSPETGLMLFTAITFAIAIIIFSQEIAPVLGIEQKEIIKNLKYVFVLLAISYVIVESVEKNGILTTGLVIMAILTLWKIFGIMIGIDTKAIDEIIKMVAEIPDSVMNWIFMNNPGDMI